MKFNSQICTTKEQSERLLALGLKAATADMCLHTSRGVSYTFSYNEALYFFKCKGFRKARVMKLLFPAWSLHRLIEMCNKTQFGMTIGIYNDEVTVDGDLFEVFDNTYDNLISIIEWLIGLDKFKKEYLEE